MNREKAQEFINFLLERWGKITPIQSKEDRELRTSYKYIAMLKNWITTKT
ncbi:MAG: hypothetical protein N2504_04550 [candidate division WOR-3 bacterium]|nr:hypothetical protein [candidate division WOR-3 bacterium]